MIKFRKLKRYIRDPYYSFGYAMLDCCPKLMPDKYYLKCLHNLIKGYELNLKNPQTLNEKLNWLKLYNRQPEYTTMVDKYEVKQYVSKIVGEKHVIPTLGVYSDFDDIDFDILPNQFVLKCTHDSGSYVICTDKQNIDKKNAKYKLSKALRKNFYYEAREWPYKNVKPRIIAEEFISDKYTNRLKDYKFFCFNGEVKFLCVVSNDSNGTKYDFFDVEFNHLSVIQAYPNSSEEICIPANFNAMKALASKLSSGIPHVRVDLYSIEDKIYFSEFTFFNFAGLISFEPDIWDLEFGKMLDLSEFINK